MDGALHHLFCHFIFHYSAIPKPSELLVEEEEEEHKHMRVEQRAELLASRVFDAMANGA